MGIEALVSTKKPTNEKMVAVKLPADVVRQIQTIRKSTGKTNTEVYSALLSEGLTAYNTAVGKTKNGKRRGRPPKAASAKASPANGRKKRTTKKKATKKAKAKA
jgi:hypothetical protein